MLNEKFGVGAKAFSKIDSKIICEKSNVLTLLHELLNDENLTRFAANNSYTHQLGFEKFVLGESPNGATLRMHYWAKEIASAEDIHSHCSDFTSHIVMGRLTQQKFKITTGSSHDKFTYRFDKESKQSKSYLSGTVKAEIESEQLLHGGESYSLIANELHRITDVEKNTLTISFWERRVYDAIVLKNKSMKPTTCNAKAGMDKNVLISHIEDIYKRIANS